MEDKEINMPLKRMSLQRMRELGIPLNRSYIHIHEKPLAHRKLKKFLDVASKLRKGEEK